MTRTQQRILAAATLGVVAALCVYYYFTDPAAGGTPRCLLKALTGYDCPGCGAQRALHALLHGRLSEAAAYNPAAAPALVLAAVYAAVELMPERFPRASRALMHPAAIMAVAAAIVAWWVARNLC